MTILTWPGAPVSSIRRTLITAAAGTVSPFTLTEDVQDWGGEVWAYEIDVPPQERRAGKSLEAFFNQLRGKVGRFLFADPSIRNPFPVGSPVASEAAGARASSFECEGLALGLYTGDFVSIGTGASTRLYQITQDAIPDADGLAVLHITPRLRFPLAVGTPIEAMEPQILLRMNGPMPANISTAQNYTFSVQAREAIR